MSAEPADVSYTKNPPPGEVGFHFNFVDWTRMDNKVSVGFVVTSPNEDDLFIVKLAIPGDTGDAAVNQLGELVGGPAWHRIQRVIGQKAESGSKLERGVLHGVLPNKDYVVEMDPRDLTPPVTIVPFVYRIVDAEAP